MALDEVVDERQRGGHALGQRRVPGRRLQGVDPHHAVRDPSQTSHLLGERARVAAVPSVRQHHDDGATRHAAHTPCVVERAQPFAEARAPGPVGYRVRGRGQRGIGVARGERPGQSGEAGGEGECLDAGAANDCGVQEAHERAGVGLHRPADVAQQHDATRTAGGLEEHPPHGLTAVRQRMTHGATDVGTARGAARRPVPAGPASQ